MTSNRPTWQSMALRILLAGVAAANATVALAEDTAFGAGRRTCGTESREIREALTGPWRTTVPSDCSSSSTNPAPEYDSTFLYMVPVVVHILMDDACSAGAVSDELVRSQIDILNEDFLALGTTLGANGKDLQVFFYLATTDVSGRTTTGITRSCNSTWFDDQGGYFESLAWDPNRYLNIYTNTAGGDFLGYVPFLPADGNGGFVGRNSDRVVIRWDAFGRDAPRGPPYDQGRTVTHEVGHYLGLEHTFEPQNQCGSSTPPDCYLDGDLICDTPVEQSPRFGCPAGASSCGSLDPITNYMDYTEDVCMEEFTPEQARRVRCTLQYYRSDLYSLAIFVDDFERGDTLLWEDVSP